jgi:hypothetical protein
MFQYAAARAAAERLGCGVFVREPDYERGWTPRSISKRLWRSARLGKQVQSQVGSILPNMTQSATGMAILIGGERFRRRVFPYTFNATTVASKNGAVFEIFNPDYFRITPRTWLSGFFQSEAYFSDMKSNVQHWFAISNRDKNHVQDIVARWPAPPDRMCAIHVRRNDYLQPRDPKSHPESGWALPTKYYDTALSLLPLGVSFAVFSDDVEFVRDYFYPLRPWVSQGNSAVQDLALMSSCKFQIIANSSFSWWAAWLNRIPDKLVIAPNFHLGWYIGEWIPGGIHVDGWSYVDVS